MCLSIAAFSYVGVEIVAASAVEARWRASSNPTQSSRTSANGKELHGQLQPTDASLNPEAPANEEQKSISDTIIFTAVFVPFFVTIAYVLGGLLESLRLKFDDCNLPKLAWINKSEDTRIEDRCNISSSPFVIIAAGSDIKGLGTAFNFFIVFTVLACANTNLYVASRTLAGLTYRLTDDRRLSRWLRWFGRTDERKVPFRAMVFSAFAFAWVPFLQLARGSFDASSGIRSLDEMEVKEIFEQLKELRVATFEHNEEPRNQINLSSNAAFGLCVRYVGSDF
ncbi:putative amino-acid permease [Colletotrichum liriopes]|uniref:Amino-acid permease n=1 Tax=Colletotrichum liriopes TaxID=708192 RepID=A0AA37GBZ6_9PEZI|nr:putative amino-acid permease [Colletotrichum liriopes]